MRDCYLEAGFESDPHATIPSLADLERKIRQYEERRGVRNVLIRCKPIFDFQLFNENAVAGNIDLLAASEHGLVIDLHKHPLEQLQIAAGAFACARSIKTCFCGVRRTASALRSFWPKRTESAAIRRFRGL